VGQTLSRGLTSGAVKRSVTARVTAADSPDEEGESNSRSLKEDSARMEHDSPICVATAAMRADLRL
jgi:hypothetical protein